MPIVSDEWTQYAFDPNPVGPASAYTAQTVIDHLKDWFAANTDQWTISAQDTNWIELKPLAGAINPDDRVLFFGGASPNAAALAPGVGATTTYVYVCYAPNAGTTGPDVSPTVGNPYTGVISSKLMVASSAVTTNETMQVYQGTNMIAVVLGVDPVGAVKGLALAGRCYNPIDTDDQFPLCAGIGGSPADNWTEQLGVATGFITSDPNPTTNDTSIYVQTAEGDGPWTECRRVNAWEQDNFKNGLGDDRVFFDIELGSNDNDVRQFMGFVLFAKGGPANEHGTIEADSLGVKGYALSNTQTASDKSTMYLWNE